MKKVAYSLVLAAGLASSSVMAADMAVKAPPRGGSSTVTMGRRGHRGFDDRLQFPRHHPVEPQAVDAGRLRAALQLQLRTGRGTAASPARASTSRTTPRRKSTSTAASARPSTSSRSISALGTTSTRAASASTPPALCTSLGGGPARLTPAGIRFVPNSLPAARRQRRQEERELLGSLRQGAPTPLTINGRLNVQEWYSPSVVNTGAWGCFYRRQRHLHRSERLVPERARHVHLRSTSVTGISAPATRSTPSPPARPRLA